MKHQGFEVLFPVVSLSAKPARRSARAAVARGQVIFNSKPINITDVTGINHDVSAGGLVAGGIPSLQGTCGTCHDTPNVGNHSFPTPLDRDQSCAVFPLAPRISTTAPRKLCWMPYIFMKPALA